MLNQRAQILLDHETKSLIQDAALAMNVSFGEAIRHAANFSYKTKQIHKQKNNIKNSRLDAAAKIQKIRKSLNLHLTVEEIKEMAHHGHKY
jgi:dimeric dUTPase (all-alpha-NTP-PPase superfamily)